MEQQWEYPWDHPDWYDLHDNTWTAGTEREPEHYRETLLALPPLDKDDHLIDVGAGTGKLSLLIAKNYSRLGQVTLIEPNGLKLERAVERLQNTLPHAKIDALQKSLGSGESLPQGSATLVTIGSVLMPIMEFRGGTLAEGLQWLQRVLAEVRGLLRPGAWLYDLETLASPIAQGGLQELVRRLHMREFLSQFEQAKFEAIECVYRFRDRATFRARKSRD